VITHADVIQSLQQLSSILDRQIDEAPSGVDRASVYDEKRLVDDWIFRASIPNEFASVIKELIGISKAIDSFYSWSALNDDRDRAINVIWQMSNLYIQQSK
jgi:hypothetical protein